MKASNGKKVLISGASFAGLASAYFLSELGYAVTLVEIHSGLRLGGTAVNIQGSTVDVIARMGLLDAIRANRLDLQRFEMKDSEDRTVRTLPLRAPGEPQPEDEFEIERDALIQLLFDAVRGRAELVFADRITTIDERPEGLAVTFERGAPRTFDLLLGCDGLHSGVRKLWFGQEARFVHSLQQYFSITIVDKLLIERNTAQLFNVPCKAVMLNAYKNKTDIIFNFAPETELVYDYRDEAQQRKIIREQFAFVGWRAAELLREIEGSTSFYFDELCQVRMPQWSKGRVALVGDAGYCASPAAGRGGSLALDGAAALANALRAHSDDHARAFREYDEKLRPFSDEIQMAAARTAIETLVPRTEEAIRARNARTDAGF